MAFLQDRPQALLLEGPEAVLDQLAVPGVEPGAMGLHRVVAQRRDQAAERREGAGVRGHDDARDAALPRERARVHGAGAAVGDQREPAQVVAALHRDQAQRAQHARVGDLHDAVGGLERREAEPPADGLHRAPGEVGADTNSPAIEPRRVQVAQHEVGVGHGGQRAALAVAGRAGDGARALRAHLERADLVHARERATACADGLHRHHGQAHREIGQLPLRRGLGRAIADEAHVGGGAAHVESEGTIDPECARHVGGRGDPRGGAGERHGERARLGRGHRHHAARRVQQAQGGAARGAAERGGEPVDVAGGQRHHARVQRGRAGALVFPELRVDLARDRDVAEVRLDRPPERLLVRRIGVGVEQAHRHRLHPFGPQGGDDPFELAGGERGLHGAVRPHPLGDLEAPAAGHQRRHPRGQLEAVEMRAVHPRDLEDVAEAARGDEADRRDAPLHDGVGDGGGAVGERGAGLARPQQRAQAVEYSLRPVVGHRGHLARPHLSGDVVDGDDVGEGAPHVHADAEAAHARIEAPVTCGRPTWAAGTSDRRRPGRRARRS